MVNARNIDLSLRAELTALRGSCPNAPFPARPAKLSTRGQEIRISLNAFKVNSIPVKPVYQYDVFVYHHIEGKEPPKRSDKGLPPKKIAKVWKSKQAIKQLQAWHPSWVFDGSSLAWCLIEFNNDLHIEVDLDKEAFPNKDSNRTNLYRVVMRKTKQVKYDQLNAYLEGRAGWTDDCLEAMTSLDHVMRQGPSLRLVPARRAFYPKGTKPEDLGSGVDTLKGIYAALRTAYFGPGIPASLVVNADVTNGVFWKPGIMPKTVMQLFNCNTPDALRSMFDADRNIPADDYAKNSKMAEKLRRFANASVVSNHRGTEDDFTIEKILPQGPRQYKFMHNDGKADAGMIDLYTYYVKIYNKTPDDRLHVVQMKKTVRGKKVVIPMDLLTIPEITRYGSRLDPVQMSKMLRVAVKPPAERWQGVNNGLSLLKWQDDIFLRNYGISISTQRVETKARILPAPDVGFANGSIPAAQASQGRWRIDGKKFFKANTYPLRSWGILVFTHPSAPDKATTMTFFKNFMSIYSGHGGQIQHKTPYLHYGALGGGRNMLIEFFNGVGNQNKVQPQLLFIVMPEKNAPIYRDIKAMCDTRWQVASQCLQAQHVKSNSAQYISNVCMKVNAKLGGITCKALSKAMPSISPNFHNIPTMIMGVDVSHPAPEMPPETPSLAAITFSANRDLTYFPAYVGANGNRVEILTRDNIRAMKGRLEKWMNDLGGGRLPTRIIYLRDGLASTQYFTCLIEEIQPFKALCREIDPRTDVKWTVLIASKRHHVRFFPSGNAGDRNGNAKPGTLVETGVTNPADFDFYLCSHAAIKGTARPVHYYCLLNEANMSPEEIQQMCFDSCFHYARATTPISQPPAAYYAHLAAARGNSLINSGEPRFDNRPLQNPKKATTSPDESLVCPLLEMQPAHRLTNYMWYV